ncbi:MAG: sensor histidine kinase [Candidatus Tectimicrobiota bacterium]|nr:MAG: sensor histidine kinase [Candidatus Tectomicrobia bacterium]
MALYRPKSFVKLVLLGFCLVAFPLILGIVVATVAVDRLAERSQQAVYRAVVVTQGFRALYDQLLTMERHARQYQVLGDAELLDAYAAARARFRQTAANMANLPLAGAQQQQLQAMLAQEEAVSAALRQPPAAPQGQALSAFAALTETARQLLAESSDLVDREVAAMQAAASAAQRTLLWQAVGLVPGALLFTAIFVLLIARPIRQLDHAIRRLGEGDFASAIAIRGPRDLEQVGQRLDWLRRRLQELEAAKTKFLRNVSHELKTPLTAIREGVELLAEEVVGPLTAQQREIVHILRQKCVHLHKLIEDLLRFSVVQARQAVPALKPVPLHRVLEEVTVDHKPVLIAKKLHLEIAATETLVWGDDEKLRIVIDNLLSNAVKYTPDGGTIRISLQRRSDAAILDVVDSGPGIAPEDKERVFEAFYQSTPSPQGIISGSGLGLAIAKEYLAALNGRIEVLHDVPTGAHFRVVLPAQPA